MSRHRHCTILVQMKSRFCTFLPLFISINAILMVLEHWGYFNPCAIFFPNHHIPVFPFLDDVKQPNINNKNNKSPPLLSPVDFTIFYHVYIPPIIKDIGVKNNVEGQRIMSNVRRIILEQLDQIGTSKAIKLAAAAAAASRNKYKNKHHHYHHRRNNENDDDDDDDNDIMSIHTNFVGGGLDEITLELYLERCERHKLDCTSYIKNYHKKGKAGQEITLANIQEYCAQIVQRNPNHRVVFLHAKGTNTIENNNNNNNNNYNYDVDDPIEHPWRRALTEGALHPSCLYTNNNNDDKEKQSCNFCSLSFQPMWTMHVPGNMWTASCEYINRLVPVQSFVNETAAIYEKAKMWRIRTNLHRPADLLESELFGLDPHSAIQQHWVGSHPSIVPCDVAPYTRVPQPIWAIHDVPHTKNFNWSLAPRAPFAGGTVWTGNFKRLKRFQALMKNRRLRLQEYTFLAGYILKWQHLYGIVPDDDSWIWNFYPDGNIWNAAVKVYGNETLSIAGSKYPSSDAVSDFKKEVLEKVKQMKQQPS